MCACTHTCSHVCPCTHEHIYHNIANPTYMLINIHTHRPHTFQHMHTYKLHIQRQEKTVYPPITSHSFFMIEPAFHQRRPPQMHRAKAFLSFGSSRIKHVWTLLGKHCAINLFICLYFILKSFDRKYNKLDIYPCSSLKRNISNFLVRKSCICVADCIILKILSGSSYTVATAKQDSNG